jgi:quercetin dioxygenase-like cupin family protein
VLTFGTGIVLFRLKKTNFASMDTMTTVSQVLDKLKKDGYTVDFNLRDNCLACHGNNLQIRPNEFVVDRYYRFEGISDPDDEAVVYAISSAKHDLKGTLVNAYGIYSDEVSDEMMRSLTKNLLPNDEKRASPSAIRSNTATPQRPQGSRPLDAPMIEMNLSLLREQIKQEVAWKNTDRNSLTLFKSDTMRIVLIALHAGAEMKTHTAPGVISVQVIEGAIAFTTEKKTTEMDEGKMLALHAGIPHSVRATKESIFLLTLSNGSTTM